MPGSDQGSELPIPLNLTETGSPEVLLGQMVLQDVASPTAISHGISLDKLERALKEGLLSRGFAKKVGLSIEEDYGPVEPYYVHMGGGNKPAYYGDYSPALLAKHWSRATEHPTNIVSIILSPGTAIDTFWPPYESTKEMGKFLRANPRLFAGIVVSGQSDKTKTYGIPTYPESKRERAKANKIAQEILSEDQELAERNMQRVVKVQKRLGGKPLPIYNFKGDLLWPVHLTHAELLQRIQQDAGK